MYFNVNGTTGSVCEHLNLKVCVKHGRKALRILYKAVHEDELQVSAVLFTEKNLAIPTR
jgi:hypothetical protein